MDPPSSFAAVLPAAHKGSSASTSTREQQQVGRTARAAAGTLPAHSLHPHSSRIRPPNSSSSSRSSTASTSASTATVGSCMRSSCSPPQPKMAGRRGCSARSRSSAPSTSVQHSGPVTLQLSINGCAVTLRLEPGPESSASTTTTDTTTQHARSSDSHRAASSTHAATDSSQHPSPLPLQQLSSGCTPMDDEAATQVVSDDDSCCSHAPSDTSSTSATSASMDNDDDDNDDDACTHHEHSRAQHSDVDPDRREVSNDMVLWNKVASGQAGLSERNLLFPTHDTRPLDTDTIISMLYHASQRVEGYFSYRASKCTDMSNPLSFNTLRVRHCLYDDADAAHVDDVYKHLQGSSVLRAVRPLLQGEEMRVLYDAINGREAILQCECQQSPCRYELRCHCTDARCPLPAWLHTDSMPPLDLPVERLGQQTAWQNLLIVMPSQHGTRTIPPTALVSQQAEGQVPSKA